MFLRGTAGTLSWSLIIAGLVVAISLCPRILSISQRHKRASWWLTWLSFKTCTVVWIPACIIPLLYAILQGMQFQTISRKIAPGGWLTTAFPGREETKSSWLSFLSMFVIAICSMKIRSMSLLSYFEPLPVIQLCFLNLAASCLVAQTFVVPQLGSLKPRELRVSSTASLLCPGPILEILFLKSGFDVQNFSLEKIAVMFHLSWFFFLKLKYRRCVGELGNILFAFPDWDPIIPKHLRNCQGSIGWSQRFWFHTNGLLHVDGAFSCCWLRWQHGTWQFLGVTMELLCTQLCFCCWRQTLHLQVSCPVWRQRANQAPPTV